MKRVTTVIILSLIIFSCTNDNINIYVGNSSFNEPNIDIKVKLNNKLVINKNFKSDSISPSLENFKLKKPNSNNLIKLTVISEKADVKYEKNININEINYLYIEYNYKVINDTLNLLNNQGYERVEGTSNYIVIPKGFSVGYSKDEKPLE